MPYQLTQHPCKRFAAILLSSLILVIAGCGDNSPENLVQTDAPAAVKQNQEKPAAQPLPFADKPVASLIPKGAADPVATLTQEQPANYTAIVPTSIRIPAIKVEAKVVEVGLTKKGAMDVPKDDKDVGWFEPGFQPGSKGSAVLAGHVDNKTGPAIFYHLKDLRPGDVVYLSDDQGKTIAFEVKRLESYLTDESPIEEIFGPSDKPLLNLITCTGTFDKKKRSHEERLVVYTEWLQSPPISE